MKPIAVACVSGMYSPSLVLPYHLSPGQWYTFVLLLIQTLPADPAGAVATLGWAFFADGVVAESFPAFGVAVGAGVFLADEGIEGSAGDAPEAGAVFAAAIASFGALYHSFTPLCPLHAPFFVVPV